MTPAVAIAQLLNAHAAMFSKDDQRAVKDRLAAFNAAQSQVEMVLGLHARAIAAAERERCAKVCQAEQLEDELDNEGDIAYMQAVRDCIAAIRALKD